MTYVAKYRCRRCGEIFNCAPDAEDTVRSIAEITMNRQKPGDDLCTHVGALAYHYCGGYHGDEIGVGDLIGADDE